MSTPAWRWLLLALCALAIVQAGLDVWFVSQATVEGTGHVALSPLRLEGTSGGEPFLHRISVNPNGASYHAGLRTGDIVDLRSLSPGNRFRWVAGITWNVEPLTLPVVRDGRRQLITVTGERIPPRFVFLLSIVGVFWMLLFAALIAWRRADSPEARTLAMLLILSNLGVDFYYSSAWVTPWPLVDAVATALGTIVVAAGSALLATYALLFNCGAKRLRLALAWLSYLSAAAYAIYGIAFVAGVWTSVADPAQAWYAGALPQTVTGILPLLFPLLCLIVTIAQTRGEDRTRIVWTSATLGPFYLVLLAIGSLQVFDPGNAQLNEAIYYYADNLIYFIAPIGLTYALLNRRLLDIGFAINRAVVFSAVSIIVVGIFVLAEWLLTEWFSSPSRTANVLISAALALALGLSVRAIHHRVDRILDTIFFRKRHEDEQAILTFANEASFVTDAATLADRTVSTLSKYADATFVTLALDDGAGRFGDVDENDPAIVALRAGRTMLDLHAFESALRGEFAFPMRARGRLIGVLVLGPKRSGDPYAPDESAAIAQLAHAAGDAIDVLSAKGDGSRESILEAMRSMTDQLSEEIRSLAARLPGRTAV
ncbi:MAG TPA: hypothetical protein VMH02_05775 [Verrucomicrobiae bacterium]|nr:hypothetical protein [Verrucomicrobiae bacterium]